MSDVFIILFSWDASPPNSVSWLSFFFTFLKAHEQYTFYSTLFNPNFIIEFMDDTVDDGSLTLYD